MKDSELLQAFEDCTLPMNEWRHRTHVKVAYLFLRSFSLEEATSKMRAGVKALNAVYGVPEGPTSGYNETTTVAFLRIVQSVMVTYSQVLPAATADEFCDNHPQLLSKHLLRLFYSPERRLHPEAKERFVEPDLTPLPQPSEQ